MNALGAYLTSIRHIPVLEHEEIDASLALLGMVGLIDPPRDEAVALNREIAANLAAVAQEVGCEIDVVSRSDSTLRSASRPALKTRRAA